MKKRLLSVIGIFTALLAAVVYLGLAEGSAGSGFQTLWHSLTGQGDGGGTMASIIWKLRFPRVMLAVLVGAALSLGGLVFQALLRNPLAEPYILGISGGSAIGAILGILLGLGRFPGVWFTAFAGSMATLGILFLISARQEAMSENVLLLSGVMVNAFCSAVIMFLVSLAQDSRLHNILFWLMGDLSTADGGQTLGLFWILLPCFAWVFLRSHTLNLLAVNPETAQSMGVNIKSERISLLIVTSLMVSATVSLCGLLGFIGLVMPHMLRLLLGSDHRILIPGSILSGGAFMVLCDLLARTLPREGEIPAGVITAMIGAPLFIYLLRRSLK